MCDHSPKREAAMVTISEGVWCDPCLAPLLKALNEGGLRTVASCCGHGKTLGIVALADGQQLFIAPSLEATEPIFTFLHTLTFKHDDTDGER